MLDSTHSSIVEEETLSSLAEKSHPGWTDTRFQEGYCSLPLSAFHIILHIALFIWSGNSCARFFRNNWTSQASHEDQFWQRFGVVQDVTHAVPDFQKMRKAGSIWWLTWPLINARGPNHIWTQAFGFWYHNPPTAHTTHLQIDDGWQVQLMVVQSGQGWQPLAIGMTCCSSKLIYLYGS